jgi:spore maturation protein CgeB
MRILMGFRKPPATLAAAIEHAGCELIHWRLGMPLPPILDIDAAVVDFAEAARHLWSLWSLRRTLKGQAPIIALDRDSPWHKGVKLRRLKWLARLAMLDIYASHSLQSTLNFAPERLYFPNAAGVDAYNLRGRSLAELRRQDGYLHDVGFLGNIDAARYPEHRDRVALLDALADRLAGHGISLERVDSSSMDVASQVAVIQSTRINLNIGAAADHGGERSWGLPERCYGIPACGGFLLSDERRHAQDDFVLEKEWVEFHDVDECVAKIRAYLANFDSARVVAEAAHAKVIERHTYSHRAATLSATIRSWKDSRGIQ